MKPDLSYQLDRIDASIFNLLDERARVVGELDGPTPSVAIGDILARHDGAMTADAMKAVAKAIDEAFKAGEE